MDELVYIDNKAIGHRIRKEREFLNLTREEFAEIVDFSPLYIGQLERGERQMSLNALVRITKCLHVSIDYLIYGDSHRKTEGAVLREEEKNYLAESDNMTFIYDLVSKCSQKELSLIEKLVKLVIPYIG